MSTPEQNAPEPNAGAPEASRPAPWRLSCLDPSFWADWASVVGLVGLVIVFGIAQPVFLSAPTAGAAAGGGDPGRAVDRPDLRGGDAGIDLSMAAAVMLGAIILGLVECRGLGHFPGLRARRRR